MNQKEQYCSVTSSTKVVNDFHVHGKFAFGVLHVMRCPCGSMQMIFSIHHTAKKRVENGEKWN